MAFGTPSGWRTTSTHSIATGRRSDRLSPLRGTEPRRESSDIQTPRHHSKLASVLGQRRGLTSLTLSRNAGPLAQDRNWPDFQHLCVIGPGKSIQTCRDSSARQPHSPRPTISSQRKATVRTMTSPASLSRRPTCPTTLTSIHSLQLQPALFCLNAFLLPRFISYPCFFTTTPTAYDGNAPPLSHLPLEPRPTRLSKPQLNPKLLL